MSESDYIIISSILAMSTVFILQGLRPDSVCVTMSVKLLIYLGALISVALAQHRLDTSLALPLHYNIETTIDVISRSFSSDGSIVIRLLQDTNKISFFANGLSNSWFPCTIENEDGEKYEASSFTIAVGSDHRTLEFKEELKAGFNYTLHFSNVRGQFGNGLVQVSSTAG